ncbi:DUF1223 domain-containing protein [Thalassospira australica]|uniref:DUF1223 domain-containing protein n=1 Tax=Thalassospira australica TaxID=1528106 RepID=UPI00384CE754
MKQLRPLIIMLATAFLGGLSLAHAAEATSPRAVIELYTSEGCNSCPPADRVLYELNQEHADLLALSFHVDYWNYLGWEDPFSSAANTERQRDYASRLRERYVYTPQVVINGDQVVRATDKSRIVTTSNEATPLREWADLALLSDNRTSPASGKLKLGMVHTPPAGQSYQLWLIGFDREQERDVRSGENAGRRLVHANVVREMIDLGQWDGQQRELDFALNQPCDGGVAILVQEGRGGPVRSASVIRF